MNPLLQALGDKPSSRQSFLYTGPSTDLDALQQNAPGAAPGLHRPPDGHQRRTTEENGGGPPRGDGPKMVSHIHVCMYVAYPHVACPHVTSMWSHVCHMCDSITCMCLSHVDHMHVICSNVTCTYTYTFATSMSHVVLYMCRVPRSASTSASLAERSCVELCGG